MYQYQVYFLSLIFSLLLFLIFVVFFYLGISFGSRIDTGTLFFIREVRNYNCKIN